MGYAVIASAFIMAGACIWLCLSHEPGAEVLEFDTDPETGRATVASDLLCFVFTGEDADDVHWEFGDGTSADGPVVYKRYAESGSYPVLCMASNLYGDRFSSMTIDVEKPDVGFLDGYEDELALLTGSVLLFLIGMSMGRDA